MRETGEMHNSRKVRNLGQNKLKNQLPGEETYDQYLEIPRRISQVVKERGPHLA